MCISSIFALDNGLTPTMENLNYYIYGMLFAKPIV